MLIFEGIDRASPDVIDVLTRLLSTGRMSQPSASAVVSFQHTTVVFTTQHLDALTKLDIRAMGNSAWRQKAVDYLRDEREIHVGLLHAIDDILLCDTPTDEVKAEVISLLLQNECAIHGVRIAYAEPIVLSTQVVQIDDVYGFAQAPERVKKLLRRPLVAAAAEGHNSLSLRVAQQHVIQYKG